MIRLTEEPDGKRDLRQLRSFPIFSVPNVGETAIQEVDYIVTPDSVQCDSSAATSSSHETC